MFKKITTIITANPKVLARKALVLTGVTLGIGIGILLNKVEDPDMVIVEELVDADEDAAQDKDWDDAEPKMVESDTE